MWSPDVLQSVGSQTIGPIGQLNNSTLTWPKVSSDGAGQDQPLFWDHFLHLCLEPVSEDSVSQNMGIFLGLESGVSPGREGPVGGLGHHEPHVPQSRLGGGQWKFHQWEPEALGNLRETRSVPRLPRPLCVRPSLAGGCLGGPALMQPPFSGANKFPALS